MPQLVLLFIVYFGLAKFPISTFLGFCRYRFYPLRMAEMGDLVRGAITSLQTHQFEKRTSAGLWRNFQLYYHIIIRSAKTAQTSTVTRMIKSILWICFDWGR